MESGHTSWTEIAVSSHRTDRQSAKIPLAIGDTNARARIATAVKMLLINKYNCEYFIFIHPALTELGVAVLSIPKPNE